MTPRPEVNGTGSSAEPLDVLAALHSTPSRRYLSRRPIEDGVLWELLDAAVRGPSGGNRQEWIWIVVTDDDVKQQIARWYHEGWQRAYGVRREEILSAEPGADGLTPRAYHAIQHLAEHLAEAPVWVIPALRNAAGSTNPRLGSSIYGAVQQLMLAARAHGIGATLTNFQSGHEDELRVLLGLPDDALTMALIPLGYPARGAWSQPRRRPIDEVVHWEQWGGTRSRGA
jgi:nitroreductase